MRAILALVLAGALLAGCSSSGSEDDEPQESPAPSPVAAEDVDAETTSVKGDPVGVADVDGAPWIVLVGGGAVLTGEGAKVEVGDTPLRAVTTPSGVWVSVIGDGAVVRIDPATGKIDKRVVLEPDGSEPEGLAWDGDSLWIVDQANDRVIELDGGGTVLGEHEVGQNPRLVSVGESGAWVGNFGGTSVTRVADGGSTTVPVVGCIGAQDTAEVDGKVFVSCTLSHQVMVLDAATMEVAGTIPEVTDADAVVTDGSTVYVVGQSGPTVYDIDPATAAVTRIRVLGDAGATQENVGAALVGSDLVVTHPDVGVYRIPLT